MAAPLRGGALSGATRGRLIAIGPLPPPPDGTSVSFALFCRELERSEHVGEAVVIDSSAGRLKESGAPVGRAELFRALRILARLLRALPRGDRVVLFGSNGFILRMAPLALVVTRLARRPLHVRVFGGSLDLFWQGLPGPMRWLLQATLARVDGVWVQTALLERFLAERGVGDVAVVPGYRALDQSAEGASAGDAPSDGPLRLVYVGHVREEKGVFDLLEALRRIASSGGPALHCDVFGPLYASARARFEQEVDALPTVRYGGVLDAEQVVATMRGYDAFVFPTHYAGEGHPGVLIEAMIAGLPIVTTAFRSIPEVVEDGVGGLLVPPEDPGALADALRALAADLELREKMARANRAARARFDARRVVAGMLARLTGEGPQGHEG